MLNWGRCHVAAYTHQKGAMISTPNKEDQSYGSEGWHSNDYMILFRDVGDGRCIIYINLIAALFDYRTIGQHVVTLEMVDFLSSKTEVLKSEGVLQALDLQ